MKARALFLLTVALLSLPALAAEPLVGTVIAATVGETACVFLAGL